MQIMSEPGAVKSVKFGADDALKVIGMVFAGLATAGTILWAVGTKAQAIQDRLDHHAVALAEVKTLVERYSDRYHTIQVDIATIKASCCPQVPARWTTPAPAPLPPVPGP